MPRGVGVILNVFAESQELESVSKSLEKIPEVIDLYEITGEYDLVAHIQAESISAFRELLKNKILKVPGIKSTVSAVIIHMYKRDGKASPE